jgi:hypothetical protein
LLPDVKATLGDFDLYDGHRKIGFTVTLPEHDGDGQGPYRSMPVAGFTIGDLSVIYLIFVPFKPTALNAPCPLVADARPRTMLEEYLKAHNEPTKQKVPFVADVMESTHPQSLAGFLKEAVRACDDVNSVMPGEGYVLKFATKNFDAHQPWAIEDGAYYADIVQALKKWSPNYRK